MKWLSQEHLEAGYQEAMKIALQNGSSPADCEIRFRFIGYHAMTVFSTNGVDWGETRQLKNGQWGKWPL